MKIVFVCTGNTCRSSMAEILAKNWIASHAPERTDIQVSSAGLAAFPGSPASSQAIEVMSSGELDLTGHRARILTPDIIRNSDLILTMTFGHKHAVTKSYPDMEQKVFTLSEFAEGSSRDISDPFAQPVEIYRHCAGEISQLLEKALPKILDGQI